MNAYQWVSIALTVLVVLGGTAVNLFILGRVIGRWGEAMANLGKTLDGVEQRVEDVEEHTAKNATKIGLIDQRLVAAEQVAQKFWEMRDEFTAMRVTVESEGRHARDKMDGIGRSISVIERQMANLVTTRAGFTTLTSEDKN